MIGLNHPIYGKRIFISVGPGETYIFHIAVGDLKYTQGTLYYTMPVIKTWILFSFFKFFKILFYLDSKLFQEPKLQQWIDSVVFLMEVLVRLNL